MLPQGPPAGAACISGPDGDGSLGPWRGCRASCHFHAPEMGFIILIFQLGKLSLRTAKLSPENLACQLHSCLHICLSGSGAGELPLCRLASSRAFYTVRPWVSRAAEVGPSLQAGNANPQAAAGRRLCLGSCGQQASTKRRARAQGTSGCVTSFLVLGDQEINVEMFL